MRNEYIDAHADFATPDVSRTGSAASMCLALAVGRGDTPLARLGGEQPLACWDDIVVIGVVIGRRDHADEPFYGQDVLRAWPILDMPHDDSTANPEHERPTLVTRPCPTPRCMSAVNTLAVVQYSGAPSSGVASTAIVISAVPLDPTLTVASPV
jgi:hypothetical protein